MKKIFFSIILCLITLGGFAQIVGVNDKFKEVTVVNDKVIFLKEFAISDADSANIAYQKIKSWGKKLSSEDMFNSNVRYNNKNKEVRVIAKIELLLPEDSNGVREKVQMKYKMNVFIVQGKCVMEVKDISYMVNRNGKKTWYDSSEVLINGKINVALSSEFCKNVEKSTLYFLNEVAQDIDTRLKG